MTTFANCCYCQRSLLIRLPTGPFKCLHCNGNLDGTRLSNTSLIDRIDESTSRGRAFAWIAAHPDAYAMFVRFALEMAERRRRFGINLLRERVRWECHFVYGSDYKFCNTHSPYVARKLLQDYPHLREFMHCKRTEDEA